MQGEIFTEGDIYKRRYLQREIFTKGDIYKERCLLQEIFTKGDIYIRRYFKTEIVTEIFTKRDITNRDTFPTVSDQNGVSLPYIMLEIHHSGREPSQKEIFTKEDI